MKLAIFLFPLAALDVFMAVEFAGPLDWVSWLSAGICAGLGLAQLVSAAVR